jgi:hypothetical protein
VKPTWAQSLELACKLRMIASMIDHGLYTVEYLQVEQDGERETIQLTTMPTEQGIVSVEIKRDN